MKEALREFSLFTGYAGLTLGLRLAKVSVRTTRWSKARQRRDQQTGLEPETRGRTLADAGCGSGTLWPVEATWLGEPDTGLASLSVWPPCPSDADAWARVLAVRPDLAPATESSLRLLADESTHRMAQLRALGNGVVPGVVAAFLRAAGMPRHRRW